MNSTIRHNIGEYAGSPDDILDRYDMESDITPINYPNWSDKKWGGVWHCHNKAMRVMETNRIKQESQERIQSQKNLQNTLKSLIIKKELKRKSIEDQKEKIAILTLKKSDSKNCMKTFIQGKDSFDTESDDTLVWLWNYMRYVHKISKGKHKKNIETMMQVIEPVMKKKGLPISGKELTMALSNITPERIKELQKLI